MEMSFTRLAARQNVAERQLASDWVAIAHRAALSLAPTEAAADRNPRIDPQELEAERLERARSRMAKAFARLKAQTQAVVAPPAPPDNNQTADMTAELTADMTEELTVDPATPADLSEPASAPAAPPEVFAHLARLAFSVGQGLATAPQTRTMPRWFVPDPAYADNTPSPTSANQRAYADILIGAGSVSLQIGDDAAAGGTLGLIWGTKEVPNTVTLGAGTEAMLLIDPEVEHFRVSLSAESLTVDFGTGTVRFQGALGEGSIGLSHGADAA